MIMADAVKAAGNWHLLDVPTDFLDGDDLSTKLLEGKISDGGNVSHFQDSAYVDGAKSVMNTIQAQLEIDQKKCWSTFYHCSRQIECCDSKLQQYAAKLEHIRQEIAKLTGHPSADNNYANLFAQSEKIDAPEGKGGLINLASVQGSGQAEDEILISRITLLKKSLPHH